MPKCMLCRKSVFRCRCAENLPASKSHRRDKDESGNSKWCAQCTCRVIDGKCMNAQCSTNKK